MKKLFLVVLCSLAAASFPLSGQMIRQFNPAYDPVSWGNPNAAVPGAVYVSRYGYWCNQPVKMAYWVGLPHYRVPPVFYLVNMNGRVEYSGTPVWMPDPTSVMVPIGFYYPGVRMYALNFSDFDRAGTYYIEVPGYPNSGLFNIRGYIPGSLIPIPGQLTFERDAGMLPPLHHFRPRYWHRRPHFPMPQY